MAKAEFLLQAVTDGYHAKAIAEMLAVPHPIACTFSVAFARTAGIQGVELALKALKIRPRFFVGIRNDITSIQALRLLLELGVDLYTVDTGSRRPIFHPKLYIIASKETAKAIVGSANLTHYGLHNNIEASALLQLDLASSEDSKFVAQVSKAFDGLIADHPKHVQKITTLEEAEQLFADGRLCDEDIVVAPSSTQQAPKSGGTQLARMKLINFAWQPKHNHPPSKKSNSAKKVVKSLSKTQFIRVWQSKPLSRRDLSIPDGKNANPTGSMGLTQDAVNPVDFQKYFRNEVFSGLAWQPRSGAPFKEDVHASFELRIENIDYGNFNLKLSQDNRTNTKSYKQRQATTAIHWGTAADYIRRPDLLDRTLSLYRKDGAPPSYLIEID